MAGPILVTGARGFAGRPLVRRLRDGGARVVGLDLVPGDHPDDACLDLADADALGDLVADVAPDRVVHLAGRAFEPGDDEGRARLRDANVTATLRLLEALSRTGNRPRFVLAGSCSVYGVPRAADGRVCEDDPVAPVLQYGATKAAQEALVLLYHRMGAVDARVARLFNLTGPGEGEGSVLGAVARQLRAGTTVLRLGTVDTVRDFVDVRDAAAAFEAILERGAPGGMYDVGTGAGETVRDRVLALAAAAGVPCRIERDEARVKPVDVPRIFADGARLRALGWAPAFDAVTTSRDLWAAAGT